MRVPFVALITGLALVAQAQAAGAQEDWHKTFEVEAVRSDDRLTIVVRPNAGYYVNSAYPMTMELQSTSVELGQKSLRRSDFTFEAAKLEGKALKATAAVVAKGEGKVDGAYKLSICTASGCSPPLKGSVSTK